MLYKSSCTSGIKRILKKWHTFINLVMVYMPCDVNTIIYPHDLIMYCLFFLCIVYNLILNYVSLEEILIHMYIQRVNSMNTTSLHNYISDECLMFCMKMLTILTVVSTV